MQVTGTQRESVLGIVEVSKPYTEIRDHFESEGWDVEFENAEVIHPDSSDRFVAIIPVEDYVDRTESSIVAVVHQGGIIDCEGSREFIQTNQDTDTDEVELKEWYRIDFHGNLHTDTIRYEEIDFSIL